MLASLGWRTWLAIRQARHVKRHRDSVPPDFAEMIPLEAHHKAADYTFAGGELVFQRTLKGLRNTVLLPKGWEVSGVSESGTIGTDRASGRAFVSLINLNADNNYKVTIHARKTID